MRFVLLVVTVLVGPLFLVSCMSLEEMQSEWRAQNCNNESAYAKGMNDGRDGKSMDPSYIGQCPMQRQNEMRAAYREGFNSGLASVRESTPGTLINVSFGGGSATVASSSSRAWYCEVSAFTSKFEAFGATQLEARRSALQSCQARYHEMHCDDVSCRVNR